MRILILGVTGMLGHTLFKILNQSSAHEIHGTYRSINSNIPLCYKNNKNLTAGVNVLDIDLIKNLMNNCKPNVVINCVGLIKQLDAIDDPLVAIPINSLFPHQLYNICEGLNTRLIHISTDCVFSGRHGGYRESDNPDPSDLYGKSKLLGEINNKNAVTIRTSIIGHELNAKLSLLEWFLCQKIMVKGYAKAFFSGLPTVELSRVIIDKILPKSDIAGLYHLASHKISKFELLKIIANVYQKEIDIIEDSSLVIDRSLNSDMFNSTFKYQPPSWSKLVQDMYEFNRDK